MADRVLNCWFVPDGRAAGERHRRVPRTRVESSKALRELTLVANFAEVWLAKQGHRGPIGINYLEKVQLPTPHAIYGAMLANINYVLMGAGIPDQVPRLLDDLALGMSCAYRITVVGADPSDNFAVRFDPAELFGMPAPKLTRPRFIAII